MKSRFSKIISLALVIAMLVQLTPMNIFAANISATDTAGKINGTTITSKDTATYEDAYIVGEVEENRTEYTKEYILSNGLHMAAVYSEPVHFENNGVWAEIDNTLKLSTTRSGNAYVNTAGDWQVSLPQNLTDETAVTLAKDGYTLSFYMSGELKNIGTEVMASLATASMEESETATYELSAVQASAASIEEVDMTEALTEIEHEDTVLENLVSTLRYADVYPNTDIVYELNAARLKESIIMGHYDSDLRGYSYILNVGDMVPVLDDDNNISLYDSKGEELIFYIPAPYLVDSVGEHNFDIDVELEGSSGEYELTYILPSSWLADEERQWPVVLDPIVQAETNTGNIRDIALYTKTYLSSGNGILQCGNHSSWGVGRCFLMLSRIPKLTSADVIVGASIRLFKPYPSSNGSCSVEVHKVNGTWASDTITWNNKPGFDPHIEDYVNCSRDGFYSWDVTDIVRGWYTGANTGMMFKADDAAESASNTWKQFYSSDYSYTYLPLLNIVFRNNNGLEGYWDYTSASAGRAGTGYVNSYTGNLVWVHNDIGFGGNRMPVSISHIYNANDSTKNTFGLGNGWRTNFNQQVYQWSANSNYYIWEDSDGTAHYFLYESANTYKDEDGLELTLTTNGSGNKKYSITDKNGNVSYFDTYGRLTEQANNQETSSSITVAYTTSTGKMISSVTDGAGRVYEFVYTDNLLSRIKYKGTGDDELSYVEYNYTNSNLTSIKDKDGATSQYTYTTNNLLSTVEDINGYRLTYTYTTLETDMPSRVRTVEESDGTAAGGCLTFDYAHNQTTVTDYSGNVQIMQFNNWGNTVSIQDDQGRAQYSQYAIEDAADVDSVVAADSSAKGNQLRLSSRLQNTVGNILNNSSFEGENSWTATSTDVTVAISTAYEFMGGKSLEVTRSAAGTAQGAQSPAFDVEAGKTYTFSAYVKTGTGSAYLALNGGGVSASSEILPGGKDWTRLEVSYTAAADATVTARLMTAEAGTVYIDCVQVEEVPTASRYNLIENGDFRYTTNWSDTSGYTTAITEEIEAAPAPQLSENVYKIVGSYNSVKRLSQTVQISGNAGETFVAAGWAKGYSVPLDSFNAEEREFALIVTFNNTDATTTKFTVGFNPCVTGWQYTAKPVVADKAYSSVTVELAYDYNVNTVYFDGIQLYKEAFGTSYTYDDEGNILSVKNVQGQITSYEYDNNNDLAKAILPTGAELTYTYDQWHNVLTATTETGVVSTFEYDEWGNNTKVSITSGDKPIYAEAVYSDDGNRLVSTTDAVGMVTSYGYDADTNVLEWVQYPEDTEATRTNYTYDDMYRMATATVTTAEERAFNVAYTYENDLLTKVTTGSTTYNFAYGDFSLRSSVSVGDMVLAEYTYTPRTNYLSSLDYGNDGEVQYTYDVQGRVTEQTYEDGDTVTYKYDNNGALASVTDSATGITTTYYYDFTDRLMKYVDSSAGYTHSVGYTYDAINNLTALVETINGESYTTSYEYDDDNRLKEVANGSVARAYTYDNSSRLSTQTTKHGDTEILTNSFTYRNVNRLTDTGTTIEAATSQVATLVVDAAGYDRTFTYTYDDNGNIESISAGTNTTTYHYDSVGQLLREDNQAAGKTWVWTYDNAGNILSRAEYAYTTDELGEATDTVNYTYGEDDWKDLLTAYDGVAISYDEIGNPLNDGTWTYNWEHGRELASMSAGTNTWNYTYDANGLRTSRNNGTANYTYVYNGGSLTQMTRSQDSQDQGDVLYFAYANGMPMSVTYNGVVYYYVTNLQGDIVAIIDSTGATVAEYSYDAWGRLISEEPAANSIGAINPLRYRGYCYDSESGLYYLQSRYYDPEVCRFINADSTDNIAASGDFASYNLYAYCGNNPVARQDDGGEAWHIVIGAAVGAIAGVAGQFVSDLVTSGLKGELTFSSWRTYVGAAVGGVASGAILAATGSVGLANAANGFVTTAVSKSLDKAFGYTDMSWAEIGMNAAVDGAFSYALGGVVKVKGVTKGTGSYASVYKAGLTKLRNETAKTMKTNVVCKGIASTFVSGLAMDGYYGLMQIVN